LFCPATKEAKMPSRAGAFAPLSAAHPFALHALARQGDHKISCKNQESMMRRFVSDEMHAF
jgi:hypothetical protein